MLGHVRVWGVLARPQSSGQLWLWRAVRWEGKQGGLCKGKDEGTRRRPGRGPQPTPAGHAKCAFSPGPGLAGTAQGTHVLTKRIRPWDRPGLTWTLAEPLHGVGDTGLWQGPEWQAGVPSLQNEP